MTRRLIALAHGGAERKPALAYGPRRAAHAALDTMCANEDAIWAVIKAVRILEDDPRFDDGHGSTVRSDGHAFHMDDASWTARGGSPAS